MTTWVSVRDSTGLNLTGSSVPTTVLLLRLLSASWFLECLKYNFIEILVYCLLCYVFSAFSQLDYKLLDDSYYVHSFSITSSFH